MSENDLDRRNLTFRQAEGLEPLPERLKLKQLSRGLRAALFSACFTSIQKSSDEMYREYLEPPWKQISYDIHVDYLAKPADEWQSYTKIIVQFAKEIILKRDYADVFDFLQYILRHSDTPRPFKHVIARALETHRAAYSVILDGGPPTIMPTASEEEAETLQQAFADLRSVEYAGAREHLRKAGEELNSGRYAESVRESIHAVESVARAITGLPKPVLPDAMKKIVERHEIHPALYQGLDKLYGWTSDEKGVRHALNSEAAKVDIPEAQFMLGACAAFVSYLIGKSTG